MSAFSNLTSLTSMLTFVGILNASLGGSAFTTAFAGGLAVGTTLIAFKEAMREVAAENSAKPKTPVQTTTVNPGEKLEKK